MGDKGSTRSHKVENPSNSGLSTAFDSSRDFNDDEKNESLLYGKISKKSLKQNNRGLINHSLNEDNSSLSSFE